MKLKNILKLSQVKNWWEKGLSLQEHVAKYLWENGKSYSETIKLIDYNAATPQELEDGQVYLNTRRIRKNENLNMFILDFVIKPSKDRAISYSLGVKNKTFEELQSNHMISGELVKMKETKFLKQKPVETDEEIEAKLPPVANESNYLIVLKKDGELFNKFKNIPFNNLPPYWKEEFKKLINEYNKKRVEELVLLKTKRNKSISESYEITPIEKPIGKITGSNLVEFFNSVSQNIYIDSTKLTPEEFGYDYEEGEEDNSNLA